MRREAPRGHHAQEKGTYFPKEQKIVWRRLRLLMQCKGIGETSPLRHYLIITQCGTVIFLREFFARILHIMCIFLRVKMNILLRARAEGSAFRPASACPFVESEVSVGLHAVKAQAAAMLCSSCPPSSPTYREQTARLSPFRHQTGQTGRQKMQQCPDFAFWPRK